MQVRLCLWSRSLIVGMCFGAGLTAWGQSNPQADKDKAAIRAAARDYISAVRSGDVEAMLRTWTKDGDYVDAAGQKYRASDLIRKQIGKPRPKYAPGQFQDAETSLRFVAPNVAIEEGAYDAGVADDGAAAIGRFTAVWVKQNDKWQLDSLREAVATAPVKNERLQPLEFLLGEWTATTDDAVILVSTHWSSSGNYLVREFAISGNGGDVTGTERIGWDADAGEIRSWTFDSQDGRGEARWKREGNRWLVETKDIMADGAKTSTSATITPVTDGQIVWESGSAKVKNQDIKPRRLKFTRAAENE